MPRDDLAISSRRPGAPEGDLVATFLELSEDAQRVYLRLLHLGVAGVGWAALAELLTRLQEDERTRELVARLGAIPRALA